MDECREAIRDRVIDIICMKKRIFLIIFAALGCVSGLQAQDETVEAVDVAAEDKTLVLPPLFDYPVAPEDLDWTARSEWLAEHFWDNFDFSQQSVGQHQLNHAFLTWTLPLRYSESQKAMEAVNSLIKKLEKNPTLLLQFTRAAENSIYSPETSETWIDEIYVKFPEALIKNKKVAKTYKTRYSLQLKTLQNSTIGKPVPAFEFTTREGRKATFNPSGKMAIVEFGHPLCSDCQMARIALKSDEKIKKYIEDGLLDIYFIIPDVDEEDNSWLEMVYDYPENWIVGAASGLDDVLDIRLSPSIYLFDKEGNLVMKNISLNVLRERLGSVGEVEEIPQGTFTEISND